jgi:hypothetical protein
LARILHSSGLAALLAWWLGGAVAFSQNFSAVRPLAPSVSTNLPAGAARNSTGPIISADGSTVVFMSQAKDLVAEDRTGFFIDVFARRLTNQTVSLVSASVSNSSGGNGHSLCVGVSTDGRYVLFESTASNLVTNDFNGASDLFLRDLVSNRTVLVSVNQSGNASANNKSFNGNLSPDGRFVVFESWATNLVTNQVVGRDVYIRDLQTATTTWVSTNSVRHGYDNAIAESPVLSSDARYVAFTSFVTNQNYNFNNSHELYVRDLQGGGLSLVSSNSAEMAGPSGVNFEGVGISSNGQFLTYRLYHNQTVPPTMIFWNAWQAPNTLVVTSNAYYNSPAPVEGAAPILSSSGRYVAYADSDSCYLWDQQSGLTWSVPGRSPLLSANDQYIALLSKTNLAGLNSTGRNQLFLIDTISGTTNLVSVGYNGTPSTSDILFPSMSADGRVFAFAAVDGNLVTNDSNRAIDVFVRNLNALTTQLISRRDPTLISSSPAGFSLIGPNGISSNGQFVAFSSMAEDLVLNDTNGFRDVFVRDLSNRTTTLVSVNTNGFSANSSSSGASISANGRYVAFLSYASDLAAAATTNVARIYRRDLQTGQTLLAGTNENRLVVPTKPSITADGQVVTYEMAGTLFRWAAASGLTNIAQYAQDAPPIVSLDGRRAAYMDAQFPTYFKVWDAQAGTTNIAFSPASRLAGFSGDGNLLYYFSPTGGTNLSVFDLAQQSNSPPCFLAPATTPVSISFNGRFAAYSIVTYGTDVKSVYVWDNLLRTNLLASPTYLGGLSTNGSSDYPSISPNGRYVVFSSTASNLISGATNTDLSVYVRDLFAGTTTKLSAREDGFNGDHVSSRPLFGADGGTITFSSAASDLVTNDFSGTADLFYFRLSRADFVDTDNDGIDDNWEMQYFGDLSHDGTGDSDGDGQSDLQEYLAGTNPTDPNSVFRGNLLAPSPNGAVVVTWKAQLGLSYRMQYKNRLEDPTWLDLPSPAIVSGSTGSATDATAAGFQQRFYRVSIVP